MKLKKLSIVTAIIILLSFTMSCNSGKVTISSSQQSSFSDESSSAISSNVSVSSDESQSISSKTPIASKSSTVNSKSKGIVSKPKPETSSSPTSKAEKPKPQYAADKLGMGLWGLSPAYGGSTVSLLEFKRVVEEKYTNIYTISTNPGSNAYFETLKLIKDTGRHGLA